MTLRDGVGKLLGGECGYKLGIALVGEPGKILGDERRYKLGKT